ncbi:MAG: hypothetical protein CVU45_04470, partial [Chloroflexi bacterium HGW-Chloroflexi-7]
MFFHTSILPDEVKIRTYHPKINASKAIYGKIIDCMEKSNVTLTGTPPKLFPTLLKGFNTIANHWYLILFPVVIDALLWLGPKLKVKTLMM